METQIAQDLTTRGLVEIAVSAALLHSDLGWMPIDNDQDLQQDRAFDPRQQAGQVDRPAALES